MNDEERANFIRNDEGLYNWWRRSRIGLYRFIRENRKEIDATLIKMGVGKEWMSNKPFAKKRKRY